MVDRIVFPTWGKYERIVIDVCVISRFDRMPMTFSIETIARLGHIEFKLHNKLSLHDIGTLYIENFYKINQQS